MTFEELLRSLHGISELGRREDAELRSRVAVLVRELRGAQPLDRAKLSAFIRAHPHDVPVVVSSVGIGHEQLKRLLKEMFDTEGYVTLAKKRAEELVETLDEEFDIVQHLNQDLAREWSVEDVLVERALWSHRRGVESTREGRGLEDAVEDVVRGLGVPYVMRTRFIGRDGAEFPCDVAIPDGLAEARIVVAVKGFDSTGSKLGDTVREIEQGSRGRRPDQYYFVLLDGRGWLGRRADLKRIYRLYEDRSVDGLYTREHLDRFRSDLEDAAKRSRLL